MRILPLLIALAPWSLAPASASTLEEAIAAATERQQAAAAELPRATELEAMGG